LVGLVEFILVYCLLWCFHALKFHIKNVVHKRMWSRLFWADEIDFLCIFLDSLVIDMVMYSASVNGNDIYISEIIHGCGL